MDQEIRFAPTRALVRRVAGHNVWIVYRFDAEHVFIMTARGEPPVTTDGWCASAPGTNAASQDIQHLP